MKLFTLKRDTWRKNARVLLIIYIVLLLLFVWLKVYRGIVGNWAVIENLLSLREAGYYNANLTWFLTIRRTFSPYAPKIYLFFFIGNFFAFIPLGLLPPFAMRKPSLLKTAAFALATILCIEALQFFTLLGYFDVDDILLNFTGALLGYGLYRLCSLCTAKNIISKNSHKGTQ